MKISNKKLKELFGVVIEGQQLLHFVDSLECFYCSFKQGLSIEKGAYFFDPQHSENCRYYESRHTPTTPSL